MGLKKNRKKSKAVTTDPRKRGNYREKQVMNIVITDSTFSQTEDGWVGKCIHCNTRLSVGHRGQTDATVEHIFPLCAGGSGSDLLNLALACVRCNSMKGIHHDQKNLDDRAREVIAELLLKRQSRWRPIGTLYL